MINRTSKLIARRASFGFTMVEVMIASTISTMASISLIVLFTMSARFIAQAATETRILSKTSMSLEIMTRAINHGYRIETAVAANRPSISADKQTFTFTIPLDGGGDETRRLRFNEPTGEIFYERGGGGNFVNMRQGALMEDVVQFYVENQEGIFSIVLVVEVDMGRQGIKRYSMVGRALPRNL